jgi:hypothetical protein
MPQFIDLLCKQIGKNDDESIGMHADAQLPLARTTAEFRAKGQAIRDAAAAACLYRCVDEECPYKIVTLYIDEPVAEPPIKVADPKGNFVQEVTAKCKWRFKVECSGNPIATGEVFGTPVAKLRCKECVIGAGTSASLKSAAVAQTRPKGLGIAAAMANALAEAAASLSDAIGNDIATALINVSCSNEDCPQLVIHIELDPIVIVRNAIVKGNAECQMSRKWYMKACCK